MLCFLLILCVIVVVHEGGHALVARLTGMRVTEFYVGMPYGPEKSHVSKRSGIRYGATLALLGGYTRICGMAFSQDKRMALALALVNARGRLTTDELALALDCDPTDAQALIDALVDLGMKVYGYDPYIAVKDAWQLSREVVRLDDLNDLCARSEYVTVHVPSEPNTWGLIGKQQIDAMPDGVKLFNYSRETLVDEDAVDAALRSGKIKQFFTDFCTPKVLRMPNTVVTPHAGAGTAEAEENCATMAVVQLKDYLENGNITNSVNYPAVHMGVCRDAGRIAALHANIPNMIGQLTAALAAQGVNITRMANESLGDNAYTLFDLGEPATEATVEALKAIPGMYRVRVVK